MSTALEPYLAFLRRLERGHVVTLPLTPGERPRTVVRALNLAAGTLGMRLSRLPDPPGAVRFRVVATPAPRRGQTGAARRPPASPAPPG